MPATYINVDPSWITAAADIPTARYYVRLAIPLDALGMGNQGIPLGLPFDSVDLEALSDGTDLYVKSPLLPMDLQGPFGVGGQIEGDLTGWVRLGSVESLAPLGTNMFFPFGVGGVPGAPGHRLGCRRRVTRPRSRRSSRSSERPSSTPARRRSTASSWCTSRAG